MNSWRSWWDSLSPDSKTLIIGIISGVVVLLVGFVGYCLRQSIMALGRRIFATNVAPAPTAQPIVIEVKTPAPPVAPEPAKPAAPSPSPYVPHPPIVGFVPRRDTEGHDILERLKKELAPEKRRLVALCGAGGLGKTTLAAEAVRALIDTFARRLAWVSADGRPEFNLSTLLDEISTQLSHTELRPLPIEQKEEQVRALVAAEPTLVVLDNFETVTDAEQTRCADWLNRTPCSAVITSRNEVEQARPVNISAMSLPEARIFVERLIAQARRPAAFKGLEHDRIITAADRNPLVLQWIVRQIDRAKQPDVVLQELAQGEGDAAQRVFGRSFDLLSEDSRASLLALSLFVPSASHAALAEVAGFGNDLKRLNEALAQSTELWLTGTTEGNKRLTIEGLTRELTKAELSKDARANEFRKRFVAYFLRYVEEHAKPTPEDFDALEADKDNVLGATDFAFEKQDWFSVMKIAGVLAKPVDGMLSVRGHWDEAIRLGEQAVMAAQSAKDEWAVAAFAGNAATMRMNRGEHSEARPTYQQALAAFRELGSEENVAISLHQLASLAKDQGEMGEAQRLYEESLEIKKKLGNQSGIANTLHQLAMLAQDQGEVEEAQRLYNQSLEIDKKLGNQSGIAISLHQLGRLAEIQGDIEEARRLYSESLEIARRLGDQRGIAITLHQLGRLAEIQGELEEARRLYDDSLEIKKRLGDQRGIASTLHQLGRLAEDDNDKVEAARLFREALSILERLKSPDAEIARQSLERVEEIEGS
jgi:tetratricopeptide (TPR) repeat protein